MTQIEFESKSQADKFLSNGINNENLNQIRQTIVQTPPNLNLPSELYVFVPDYEACESCAVNVTPEIIGGQGPYRDIWINLETGDTLNSITNPNINPNDL